MRILNLTLLGLLMAGTSAAADPSAATMPAASAVAAPPLDWAALDRAYESAMTTYRALLATDKAFLAHYQAISELDKADIGKAFDAPLGDFSRARAAAIFNDYGFLIGENEVAGMRSEYGFQRSSVEVYEVLARRAVRRAIELDPERPPAYLNLGDILRAGLGRESDWERKKALKREAEQAYGRYLALGGKSTPWIAAFLNDDWDKATAGSMCSAVATIANQGRLAELLTDSVKGFVKGKKLLDLTFHEEGTAHVPAIIATDVATGKETYDAVPVPNATELWGGDYLRLLVYAGRSHTLVLNDIHHPSASIALDGSSACKFDVHTTEVLNQNTTRPALCLNILRGQRPTALPFDGAAWMSGDDVRQDIGNTSIAGVRTLDVLNNGHPATVALLRLTSGAGPGCDSSFFDQLDEDATKFESGSIQNLLMDLQGAHGVARHPVQCGNDPRFFTHEGRIYFETRPRQWPPFDARTQYHSVREVADGQVVDTCQFRFDTKVTGRTVDPRSVMKPEPTL